MKKASQDKEIEKKKKIFLIQKKKKKFFCTQWDLNPGSPAQQSSLYPLDQGTQIGKWDETLLPYSSCPCVAASKVTRGLW